jgi:hypothetical protein
LDKQLTAHAAESALGGKQIFVLLHNEKNAIQLDVNTAQAVAADRR